MARKIIGVIAGLAAAVLVIWAFENVGHRLYPMPPGIEPEDREALAAWIDTLPLTALLVVLAGAVAGSFVGGAAATLVARVRSAPALVVGALLTVAGIANVVMIPHPLWYAIVTVVVYLPFAWLGSRVAPLRGTG